MKADLASTAIESTPEASMHVPGKMESAAAAAASATAQVWAWPTDRSDVPAAPTGILARQKLGWTFVVLWAASYAIGYAPRRLFAPTLVSLLGFDFYGLHWQVQLPVEYLVGGLALGLVQWLMLRRRGLPVAWIPLTAFGLVVGESVWNMPGSSWLLLLLEPAIAGAIPASAQWLALRRLTSRAAAWIPISSAAYILAIVLFLFAGLRNDYAYQAAFGALTGVGMRWILRKGHAAPAAQPALAQ